jgi:hypothetical protein
MNHEIDQFALVFAQSENALSIAKNDCKSLKSSQEAAARRLSDEIIAAGISGNFFIQIGTNEIVLCDYDGEERYLFSVVSALF